MAPVPSESPRAVQVNLITEPDIKEQEQQQQMQEQKKADFTFKMPTKLLGSTIGKSDTNSSAMLSYKFSKENVFYQDPNASGFVDRDGDDY